MNVGALAILERHMAFRDWSAEQDVVLKCGNLIGALRELQSEKFIVGNCHRRAFG